jgi:hypothetical protein
MDFLFYLIYAPYQFDLYILGNSLNKRTYMPLLLNGSETKVLYLKLLSIELIASKSLFNFNSRDFSTFFMEIGKNVPILFLFCEFGYCFLVRP